jgi:hypothetical protein
MVMSNYKKLHFPSLLNRFCPKKLLKKDSELTEKDKSFLVEMISETTQASTLEESRTEWSEIVGFTAESDTGARKEESGVEKRKPRFAEFVCSHREVGTLPQEKE